VTIGRVKQPLFPRLTRAARYSEASGMHRLRSMLQASHELPSSAGYAH
jgi:hypothetical protein